MTNDEAEAIRKRAYLVAAGMIRKGLADPNDWFPLPVCEHLLLIVRAFENAGNVPLMLAEPVTAEEVDARRGQVVTEPTNGAAKP